MENVEVIRPTEIATSAPRVQKRVKVLAGTSYARPLQSWDLPRAEAPDVALPTEEGHRKDTIDNDSDHTGATNDEPKNLRPPACTVGEDVTPSEFEYYFLAASAKGFREDGGYGVIGVHVSEFLSDCGALLNELLTKLVVLERATQSHTG
jgi:hypothetical protein